MNMITVSNIFVWIVLIITIFKLNRNIRETEKKIEYFDEDRTEKEIYKNSYVELRDEFINFRAKMEEEKLKFSTKESEKESTFIYGDTSPILLRIEVNGIPTDVVDDQYYSINCTKLDSYDKVMANDEDFSYILGSRLGVLYRYRHIEIHSINRVSIKIIEPFEVPKVIAEDFISYLENKKIEITEFIKNSELPQERKDNLKKDLDTFIKNANKEIKRSIV